MNSQSWSTLAIFGFVILGTVCLELRREAISRDEAAREDTYWELSYAAKFDSVVSTGPEQSQVKLAVPFDTRHCQLDHARENSTVTNPGLHSKVTRPYLNTGNRMLVLATRQSAAASYEAKAKFFLRLSPRANVSQPVVESPPPRERFLQPEVELPTTDPAVRQVAKSAPADAQTDFERLQWAFEYCSNIDATGDGLTDDAKAALTTKRGTPLARARAMTTLCRVLGFPSRLVTGFVIRQGADVHPHIWLEVYQNQQWEPFDPTNGYSLNLPMEYVPVRRDADVLYSSQNVTGLTVQYLIKRLPPDPRITQAELQDPLQILNLRRLPIGMHRVMTILLLLPFAALITTLMRNVVGIGTFGTFSPALLAMSFIYADWKIGLTILMIVFTVGLLGRWSLERLRLLTVPRLSIILTLVILCVVFGISALQYSMPGMKAEVVLLPMIILTNLIERFHVTADEDGLFHTMKLALGTLVVALLCYLVLGSQQVGSFVLTYPEAHFFTIAVFIVLGRYAGYRLTELWRFRDLVEPAEAA
jgi:hypothetical protein